MGEKNLQKRMDDEMFAKDIDSTKIKNQQLVSYEEVLKQERKDQQNAYKNLLD